MSAADVPADPPLFSRPVAAAPAVAADRRGGERRDLLVRAFLGWLPIAATLVVVSGLVYLTTQQSLRSGANDPQLQVAGDLASQLGGGADPAALLGTAKVDLATSLAPYAIVFDDSGTPVASTAVLDGRTPVPPAGVLRAARAHRAELTWQPRSGVRSAIVVVPYHAAGRAGTVVVGRSLTEVERREDLVLKIAAAGLAGGLVMTAGACLAAAWLRRRLQVA